MAASSPPRSSRPAAATQGAAPSAKSTAFRKKSATRDIVFGLAMAAVGGILSLGVVSFRGDVLAGIGVLIVGVVYLAWGLYKLATPPRAPATASPSRR